MNIRSPAITLIVTAIIGFLMMDDSTAGDALGGKAAAAPFAPVHTPEPGFVIAGEPGDKNPPRTHAEVQARAEQGDAMAEEVWGMDHLTHVPGIPYDPAEGVKWLRRSAEHGRAGGQVNLGVAYQNGIGGLSRDYVQAYLWYRRAVAQGDQYGGHRVALSYFEALKKTMTPEQIAQAERLADSRLQ